jgi:polyribonucleotide nucleotidyltransferase
MTNSVYIVGDDNGSVINLSKNNPNYGWITLRQDKLTISNNWAQNKSVSTLITGEVNVLEAFNFAAGQVLDGHIVIREQLTPFTAEDRDIKVAGSTGVICSVKGQAVYRKTFYTEDMTQKDIFVAHDNTEEIRQALAVQKLSNVTPSIESLVEADENVFEI